VEEVKMMNGNPWMKTVTLPNANQNYNLLTLMQSIDIYAPERVHKLQLQADPVHADASYYRVGNEDLSDTNYGVVLFSTQAFGIEAPTNSLSTKEFYLRCTTGGKQFAVIAHIL
jgi:hypothetical protein